MTIKFCHDKAYGYLMILTMDFETSPYFISVGERRLGFMSKIRVWDAWELLLEIELSL